MVAISDPHQVILRPVHTERTAKMSDEEAVAASKQGPKYVFEVDAHANKFDIRKAVEEIFGVKVTAVNTSRVRGKMRRASYRTRPGMSRGWKKATVTLRSGDHIDLAGEVG